MLLAYVAGGHLHVVDAGASRQLAQLGTVSQPSWSASGRWLAYVSEGGLWMARADGSQAQRIGTAAAASWSPVTPDRLAVASDRGLLVTAPNAAPLTLAGGCSVGSFAWSADGTSLAAACGNPGGVDRLVTFSAAGGTPATVDVPAALAGGDAALQLAGWWPGGLLVWIDPHHSASIAADGMSLLSISATGAQPPRTLATTLGYTSWLAWSPDHRHLLIVEGGDRMAWTGKRLAVCDVAAGTCSPLPSGTNTVDLDPAWSPDGRRIAFVRASALSDTGGETPQWTASRTLWTAAADGSNAAPVSSAPTGISAPHWSGDSTQLAVVAGDRVVLVEPGSGAVTIVASGIDATSLDYYGSADWSAVLAWAP